MKFERSLAIAAVVCSSVLALGCGKKGEGDGKGGGSCGALSVTVEGEPLEIKKQLAVFDTKYETLLVYGFNYDSASCDSALKGMFQHPEGGTSVRVTKQAVGLDAHTQMGGDVKVKLGAKPAKAGETVTACVEKISFKSTVGTYKDKEVTISGGFSAEYCGESGK